MSVNVDVEPYLGREAPRVCLSVHKGVCAGMCLCAHAVTGVGRGRQPCQGQGMGWRIKRRYLGMGDGGSCKSVPRGNNQCLEEGGPCAHLLVVSISLSTSLPLHLELGTVTVPPAQDC